MDHDDKPVGRILNRREVLALLGGAGAAFLAGRFPSPAFGPASARTAPAAPAPGCVVRPEQTEGPFFVSERPKRSDLRLEDATGTLKAGVPLALSFRVFGIREACTPLEGAVVDVWHCDAQGNYSGVTDRTEGLDTVEQTWLRGFQRTGADGVARFTTVYPGWYPGRAVHIHFKVRTGVTAGDFEFTSQLYFDDALSDRVFQEAAYARPGARDTLNADDFIFAGGGNSLLLEPAETADGYAASFDLGLDLSDGGAGDADPDRGYPDGRS